MMRKLWEYSPPIVVILLLCVNMGYCFGPGDNVGAGVANAMLLVVCVALTVASYVRLQRLRLLRAMVAPRVANMTADEREMWRTGVEVRARQRLRLLPSPLRERMARRLTTRIERDLEAAL